MVPAVLRRFPFRALSLLRVGFAFSFSVEGKGVATKATKSKGSEVPERVTPSLPVNSRVVFCTSPWKCHSQGGFLVPFPPSFAALCLYGTHVSAVVLLTKCIHLFFLPHSKKTATEREESGAEEGCPQSCRCTCRGESLVNTDTALVLRASVCHT